jgi:dihydroorotase
VNPPAASSSTVLTNAHVLDPATGLDAIASVTIRDGVIAAVGDEAIPPGAEIIDAGGAYLSPGWLDVHVHAYGTLGFADPDSIGIYQGVTTFVEAGGPGVGTIDEFVATMGGRTTTSLYAGVYIRPLGIIGLTFIEDDVRNWMDVPIERWIDTLAEHRDLIRYLKMGAFTKYGPGPLKLGKGLAETLGLPLYVHIGEFAATTGETGSHDIFRIAEAGDMITHLYHKNLGGVLDDDGRVRQVVRDAEKRGVLFDIGFGGYNFSWDVAEKAYAQDLVPHMISSDLQQFNVTGPVYSLANVLSIFLKLGLSINEIIARVTINPARALALDDRAGALRVGAPADLTVFRTENNPVTLADCFSASRTVDATIVPIMTFKNGRRYDADMQRCQDESNWFMQIAEDEPPAATAAFSSGQRRFLQILHNELAGIDWHVEAAKRQDIRKATHLQHAVHTAAAATGITLRDALDALYRSFVEHPFAVQSGLFLLRLERTFVLERLRIVAAGVAVEA